ncbi:MAG: hypothetical protein WBG71_03140 [Leeuwenhoekiella sp.]
MKIFTYILLGLAALLLVFNITKIEFEAPMVGDSKIAIISVLACACAIVLLIILMLSKRIAEKHN